MFLQGLLEFLSGFIGVFVGFIGVFVGFIGVLVGFIGVFVGFIGVFVGFIGVLVGFIGVFVGFIGVFVGFICVFVGFIGVFVGFIGVLVGFLTPSRLNFHLLFLWLVFCPHTPTPQMFVFWGKEGFTGGVPFLNHYCFFFSRGGKGFVFLYVFSMVLSFFFVNCFGLFLLFKVSYRFYSGCLKRFVVFCLLVFVGGF